MAKEPTTESTTIMGVMIAEGISVALIRCFATKAPKMPIRMFATVKPVIIE